MHLLSFCGFLQNSCQSCFLFSLQLIFFCHYHILSKTYFFVYLLFSFSCFPMKKFFQYLYPSASIYPILRIKCLLLFSTTIQCPSFTSFTALGSFSPTQISLKLYLVQTYLRSERIGRFFSTGLVKSPMLSGTPMTHIQ